MVEIACVLRHDAAADKHDMMIRHSDAQSEPAAAAENAWQRMMALDSSSSSVMHSSICSGQNAAERRVL